MIKKIIRIQEIKISHLGTFNKQIKFVDRTPTGTARLVSPGKANGSCEHRLFEDMQTRPSAARHGAAQSAVEQTWPKAAQAALEQTCPEAA